MSNNRFFSVRSIMSYVVCRVTFFHSLFDLFTFYTERLTSSMKTNIDDETFLFPIFVHSFAAK